MQKTRGDSPSAASVLGVLQKEVEHNLLFISGQTCALEHAGRDSLLLFLRELGGVARAVADGATLVEDLLGARQRGSGFFAQRCRPLDTEETLLKLDVLFHDFWRIESLGTARVSIGAFA